MEGSTWTYALGAIGVGALSLAAAAYWYQDYLLYFPSMPPGARTQFENPAAYRLHEVIEEVMIRTPDDERLHAMVFAQGAQNGVVDVNEVLSAPTVVFFHGNAGNLSHRLAFFSVLFRRIKCNVVGVEYRGFGRSSGTPSEKALRADAITVYKWLHTRKDFVNPNRIVLFGRSLGGAVALHLARDIAAGAAGDLPPPAAVVAENTFTSVPDMVPHVMPLLRRLPRSLITNEWDNKAVVTEIEHIPVLLIRGEQDELVPSFMSVELHDAGTASNPHLRIMSFPGGHHMDTWLEGGYAKRVREYLDELGLFEPVDE